MIKCWPSAAVWQLVLVLMCFSSAPLQAALALTEEEKLVFIEGSYSDKKGLVNEIGTRERSDENVSLLAGIQEGEIFYHKESRRLARILEKGEKYEVTSLEDGRVFILEDDGAYKKVRINNSVRRALRGAIAQLQLQSDDSDVRLNAIGELLRNIDDEAIALVASYAKTEQEPDVKEAMDLVVALGDINSGDKKLVSGAIEILGNSLEPVALIRLKEFEEEAEDDELKSSASFAISRIQGKIKLYEMLETFYFGLSFGSVLVLAGIGLAITFGVMGVINMAHGELIMLGAYTTYVIQQLMPEFIELSIIVAIPAAFLVSALAGITMERLVIRHLYSKPLETLLATFGISLILQQAVRTIFSPLNKTVVTPEWMSGLLEVNSVFSLTWNRLYIIFFCLMVFMALVYIMKYTSLGLQVRAVSQNRAMARAMGVRSQWVDVLTFGLGSGIAGVAGVALSLLTNVGPNLGQSYIIDSFMVVVFGGVGNLLGTLFAGMSLGVMNKVMEPWAGAVLAKIIILVFIIMFIQKRPQGLFPQRGRAAEG